MSARNNTKRRTRLELNPENGSMEESPSPLNNNKADVDQPGADARAPGQPPLSREVVAANAPYTEGERASFRQRVAALARNVRRKLLLTGAARAARHTNAPKPAAAAAQPQADAVSAPVVPEAPELITQINELDRQYMEAFPPQLKAQVLQKIASLAPVENVAYQGDHRFEKAMMILHREGYGLIDMQPNEAALCSVWYRKDRKLIGPSMEEVTMLMWEEHEQGDTTTVMRWSF